MQTGATITGIIGGLLGIAAGVLAIGLGSLGAASEAGASNTAIVPGTLAIVLAVVGLAGAAIAGRRAATSAALQAVAAVGGFFFARMFWIPAGLLLTVGAGLALAARDRGEQQESRGATS